MTKSKEVEEIERLRHYELVVKDFEADRETGPLPRPILAERLRKASFDPNTPIPVRELLAGLAHVVITELQWEEVLRKRGKK